MTNNEARISRATQLTDYYPNRSEGEACIDILADLMHFCNYHSISFEQALGMAELNFEAEKDEDL